MIQSNTNYRSTLEIMLMGLYGVALVIISLAISTNAQKSTDGSTPVGLAPGSPAGSYSLSGFESVNLFNGNLDFSLPLLKVGGRGDAATSINLTINSVSWIVKTEPGSSEAAETYDPYNPGTHPPIIGGNGSGTPAMFTVEPDLWEGLRTGYGPGILQGRLAKRGRTSPTLTRLTFTAPDGTEYELIDVLTGGKPLSGSPRNRGTVFVSANGTSITFVSNQPITDGWTGDENGLSTPSGYMMMSNGTRYDIVDGLVMKIRDRNGNQLKYTYYSDQYGSLESKRVSTITDSLGRVVEFTYADLTGSTANYDQISFKGFAGTGRTIKIWRGSLSSALRTTQSGDSLTTKSYGELFPDVYQHANGGTNGATLHNPNDVATSVELPDGRRYWLCYNVYGELARIVLSTGGAIEFDYTIGSGIVESYSGFQIHRRVLERRVYADGNILQSRQSYSPTYTPTYSGNTIASWTTDVMVENHDMLRPSGSTLESRSKHTFFGSPVPSLFKSPLDYSEWREGREKQVETFEANSNSLSLVTNTWQQCTDCELNINWWTTPPQPGHTAENAPPNNPHVVVAVNTLRDTNQVSKQTFVYDKYNNPTDVLEYDFGDAQPGQFLRKIHMDYVVNTDYTSYTSSHLRGLPLQSWVSSDIDGNNKASFTVYEYDNYNTDTKHAPLVERANVTGFDSGFGGSYVRRGNLTATTKYAKAQNQTEPVTTYSQYDILGNVVKTIDGRGTEATVGYEDRFGVPDHGLNTSADQLRAGEVSQYLNGKQTFASVTRTTNAMNWTAYSQFDYFAGVIINTADANGVINKTVYNDLLDRPTQAVTAIGTSQEQQASVVYDDDNLRVQVTSDLKSLGDNLLKSESFYDKLGRVKETRSYKDGDYSIVENVYDGLGKIKKVTNPYRPLRNEQPIWTETKYDSLGRVKEVKTPDGAKILKSYLGNTITITDQAGKKRTGVSNALGRMIKVIEDPSGQNLVTDYVFDAMGNLRKTTQGEQKRYFMQDSLGRLLYSKQSEQEANLLFNTTDPVTGNQQWSVEYKYDNNGNIESTTDARNISVRGTYDQLNRLIYRDYSDQTTPDVSFFYDGTGLAQVPNFSKGKLTKVSSSVSETRYTSFDDFGRVKSSQQITNGKTYNFPDYSYDLAGNLISQTYPSGKIITNYFNQDGDLTSVYGQNPNQQAKVYINQIKYNASGGVKELRLGNGRWETTVFNDRLQVTQIGLGYSNTDKSLLKVDYSYGTDSENNGLLKQQKINYTGLSSQIVQSYDYDNLNRVKTSKETFNGGTQSWKQTFSYDRFGNRWFDAANTTTLNPSLPSKVENPQINTSDNRLKQDQDGFGIIDYDYDKTGNLTKDAENQRFVYDAENRQTQFFNRTNGSTNPDAIYYYDGNGQRVRKISGPVETIFVYDAQGQLIAEYSNQLPENPKVNYLTADPLGSPRIVTDQSGQVVSRHDYMTFGEEIFAGANRTSAQGYGASDKIRKQYTAYERDNESGLDYAQARYYNSRHGRFTSVDPLTASATIRNPQTFNRYSYALNAPYKFTDPLGLNPCCKEEIRKIIMDELSNPFLYDDGSGSLVVDAKDLNKIADIIQPEAEKQFDMAFEAQNARNAAANNGGISANTTIANTTSTTEIENPVTVTTNINGTVQGGANAQGGASETVNGGNSGAGVSETTNGSAGATTTATAGGGATIAVPTDSGSTTTTTTITQGPGAPQQLMGAAQANKGTAIKKLEGEVQGTVVTGQKSSSDINQPIISNAPMRISSLGPTLRNIFNRVHELGKDKANSYNPRNGP